MQRATSRPETVSTGPRDGASSWAHVGLRETKHISRVRIHPTNPDIVTSRRWAYLRRQRRARYLPYEDGGESWERVLSGRRSGAADLTRTRTIRASWSPHCGTLVPKPWNFPPAGPAATLPHIPTDATWSASREQRASRRHQGTYGRCRLPCQGRARVGDHRG